MMTWIEIKWFHFEFYGFWDIWFSCISTIDQLKCKNLWQKFWLEFSESPTENWNPDGISISLKNVSGINCWNPRWPHISSWSWRALSIIQIDNYLFRTIEDHSRACVLSIEWQSSKKLKTLFWELIVWHVTLQYFHICLLPKFINLSCFKDLAYLQLCG